MIKKLTLNALEYQSSWSDDVKSLVQLMDAYGYQVSELEIYIAWKDFSKKCGGEWVSYQWRGSDKGTIKMLLKDYFKEIK